MLRGVLTWYDAMLHKRPLLTKMVTSGVVVSSSDVSMQFASSRNRGAKDSGEAKIDLQRTLLIGVGYGSLCFSPVLHFVTTRWAKVLPSKAAPALVFKTVVDMTTSLPFNLSVMLLFQSIARQKEGVMDEHIEAVKSNIVPAVFGGWKFWPVVTMSMHAIVPVPYRVLYLNGASFFWNAWMISRFEK